MLKTVSTNRKLSKRADGLYIDPQFERNYAECKRLGIPVGVYYYTYAVSRAGADAELAMLKSALTGKTFELPVAVDVEDNKLHSLGKQALTNQVLSALGKPVLPIESAQLEQLVTTGITTVAALVSWWENNSFTQEAIRADELLDQMQGKKK